MIDELLSISFSGPGLWFVLLACFFYRLRWKYYFEIMECLFIHGGMDGCVFL